MKKIFLDNCKTTKPSKEVIQEMSDYMENNFYFPQNFISVGTEIQDKLESFKKNIAETISADENEFHFTNSGTLANNIAIKGFISANASKGNHIICSVVDYPDILTNAAFFENSGFEVTYISADENGFIDLEELKNSIKKETILMMTTLSNHTVGTIQPIKKIRNILDSADQHIALHVDACHAYGKMPIDVKDLDIDLLSITAHKIHGPQGIGGLYIKKGTKISQVIHGINRVEPISTGALSIPAIAGFNKAAELWFKNEKENQKKLRELSGHLLKRISEEIPHILVNGPVGQDRISHNMNITIDFIEGEAIMMLLDMDNIIVATGSACASQGLATNYILRAMGRTHVQSHGSIKFTVSIYNTIDEIEYTVKKLKEAVEQLRNQSPLYTDFLNKNK